jgi:hypothetical protein
MNDTREKIERMLNPQTAEDYGLAVAVSDIERDAPDYLESELVWVNVKDHKIDIAECLANQKVAHIS